MRLEPFARPDWSPLPFEGCVGVEGKVLVREPGFFSLLDDDDHADVRGLVSEVSNA